MAFCARAASTSPRPGGTVVAQDRATSEAFGMPSAAIGTGCVDFVLPLGTIPSTLVRWAVRLFGAAAGDAA